MDAQLQAEQQYTTSISAAIIATFTEIEAGKLNTRPELTKALHLAKVTGAIRVIAKLDRLSRNAAFLITLQDAGVKFIAADLPQASNLTIGIRPWWHSKKWKPSPSAPRRHCRQQSAGEKYSETRMVLLLY